MSSPSKALQEIRRDLSLAQAVSHTGSWRLDVNKNELSWSEETRRIFDIKKDSRLTYELFLSFIHPLDRSYVNRKWSAALRGEPYDIEHRIVTNGKVKWVRERAKLEFDRKGKLLGGFGTVQDITELKGAQEEVEKLSRFPGENPSPILRVAGDCRILYANKAAGPLLKYWRVKVGEQVTGTVQASIKKIIASRIKKEIELDLRDKTFSCLFVPIKGAAYTNIYCRDITKRKRAEEALREAHGTLEVKVERRTEELTQANRQLIAEISKRRTIERLVRLRGSVLKIMQISSSRKGFLDTLVKLIKGLSSCRYCGIRVLNQEGEIPYESYSGFSRDFWEKENWLSIKHDQCACIRVVKGQALPQDLPCMTKGGSFVTNDSLEFVSGLSRKEKALFRGVCMEQGFKSVAVVPVRYNNEVIAAIHLADERKDMVLPDKIGLIEFIAVLIGEGIHKFDNEDRIKQGYVSQGLINDLMRFSLGENSLENIFKRCLELLFSISWLSVESKGSIFLLEEKTGALVLKAQKDLPEFLRNECRELPLGKCLCGRAAKEKKIQFAANVGKEHEITYEGMPPHGHYCVPILSGEKLLGVINLYLPAGYKRDFSKEEFLNIVANSLAMIIQRHRAENSLLESNKLLEQARRLSDIGALAATVAHELRNPLAAMGMAAHNIKRKTKEPELLERHLHTIEKKIIDSDEIINNLLFYSRLRPPRPEDTDLHGLLRECLHYSKKRFKKNARLKNKFRGLKGISIKADPLQIKEVFQNILNNAYDAIPDSKGVIEIGAEVEDGRLLVYFKDQGAGISADDLSKVFDPFFTTKAKGTGLGLSVCKQIVELHGGTINIESQLNKGTTVTVALPRDK